MKIRTIAEEDGGNLEEVKHIAHEITEVLSHKFELMSTTECIKFVKKIK